jgi:hypothetical protein
MLRGLWGVHPSCLTPTPLRQSRAGSDDGVHGRRRGAKVQGLRKGPLRRSARAPAGGLPDGHSGRIPANIFNFTGCVTPRFTQATTDAPKADLFQRRQVHRRRPRECAGTDSPGPGLIGSRLVATRVKGCVHNLGLVAPPDETTAAGVKPPVAGTNTGTGAMMNCLGSKTSPRTFKSTSCCGVKPNR